MIDYFMNALKFKYADFDGRARRSEYWYFGLCASIIYILLLMLSFMLGNFGFVLVAVFLLGIVIPSISVLVRRLHDIGKSGWYYFVSFIPIVGAIWMIVMLCTDSEVGNNQYGPNPKGIGNSGNLDDQISGIGKSLES